MNKGRILLHWVGAALCAVLGVVGIPLLLWFTSSLSVLAYYAYNAVFEVLVFALPALLLLSARPERWQRFRRSCRALNMYLVGHSALLAVSGTVVVSLIVVFWSLVLRQGGYTAPAQELPQAHSALEWAIALMSVAVIPALTEEVLFRGLLQGAVLHRWPRTALWLTALVFAAVHLQWDALPGLYLVGLVLGKVYERHGYFASVLLHALYNAVVLVLSTAQAGISPLLLGVCIVAAWVALRGLLKEEKSNAVDDSGV